MSQGISEHAGSWLIGRHDRGRLAGSAAVADAGHEADLVSAIAVPSSATRGMLGRLFGR